MALDKTLRILFVSLTYPPYIGGAEKQLMFLSEKLIQNNIKVKIFTIHHKDRILKKNIISAPFIGSKINLLNKFIWVVCLFFQLLFTNSKNSIIYSFGLGLDKFIIYFISKLKKIPYVIKIAGTLDSKNIARLKKRDFAISKFLQNIIVLKANRIVVQDKISILNFIKYYKVSESKISLIKNGVKINKYKTTNRIKNILFVGRIVKEKGIFELIEAFRLIKEEKIDLSLTIVGIGPDQKYIDKKITGLEFKGKSYKTDKFYNNADLFVFPSYNEGLPNVVLEAMSYGIPVISTPVGALPEIFENDKHIFYIKKNNNINLIKNKIKYLCSNIEIAEKVSFNAYSKLKREFLISSNCEKYIQLFNQLIN